MEPYPHSQNQLGPTAPPKLGLTPCKKIGQEMKEYKGCTPAPSEIIKTCVLKLRTGYWGEN